jgi:hypothetical protein
MILPWSTRRQCQVWSSAAPVSAAAVSQGSSAVEQRVHAGAMEFQDQARMGLVQMKERARAAPPLTPGCRR